MIPSPHNNEKNLERVIHQTLRSLPSRRAPGSLEQRVLAEIERRAALPWWRKSFVHWPVAARGAFLVACFGAVAALVLGGVSVMSGFDPVHLRTVFATPLAWLESGRAVVNAVLGFFEIMLRNIPTLWLYGGLAFVASMYVALFGLGAAAYRALYAQR